MTTRFPLFLHFARTGMEKPMENLFFSSSRQGSGGPIPLDNITPGETVTARGRERVTTALGAASSETQ